MVVDLRVYHWTPSGMKEHIPNAEGFVTVLDAEAALEAAFKRGYERAKSEVENNVDANS